MNKQTFPSLFNDGQRVVIPLIQRDYAQGRADKKASEVRDIFIRDLRKALTGNEGRPIMLDFIFGYSEKKRFIPFDGQQRLTTLFLLYLYAAIREQNLNRPEVLGILGNFRYEVREGVSIFGAKLLEHFQKSNAAGDLVKGKPEGKNALSAHIKGQPWFSPEWQHDPTISGMLVMLDTIQKEFCDAEDLWNKLTREDAPIQFYFSDIRELNSAAEDLFIKMNARGKELTPFEIFKARFLEWLTRNHPDKSADFARKLDKDWLQLFWKYFSNDYSEDKAQEVDAHFYHFLVWLAEIFTAGTAGEEYIPRKFGEVDLFAALTEALAGPAFVKEGNLAFLENTLDWLAQIETKIGLDALAATFFHETDPTSLYPVAGRISWFRSIRFFKDVCDAKGPAYAQGEEFLAILLARPANNKSELSPQALGNLRILRNLIDNSEFELRPDNYPKQLKGIVKLIRESLLDLGSGFNAAQLREESVKIDYRKTAKKGAQADLDWLEDHPLLRGCVSVFGSRADKGNKPVFTAQNIANGRTLFKLALGSDTVEPLDKTLLLRALLSQGHFYLRDGNFAYMNWEPTAKGRAIFTSPNNGNFNEIRSACQKLGAEVAGCVDQSALIPLLSTLIDQWLKKQETAKKVEWIWYFVKYPVILPFFLPTRGYYLWSWYSLPFILWQMSKKFRSSNYWNPFLWAAWKLAALPEDDNCYEFRDCYGKDGEEPIYFYKLKLYLWPWEYGWRVWSLDDSQLRSGQQTRLDDLRKILKKKGIVLDEEGYCEVAGTGTAQEEAIREYDGEDRVSIGATIIKAMGKLSQCKAG